MKSMNAKGKKKKESPLRLRQKNVFGQKRVCSIYILIF